MTESDTSADVEIAAEAYDPNTEDALMTGTRHILVDGEPLCGNPSIASAVERGDYHREPATYPVSSYDTCGNCGQIYLKRFGSEDPLFERLPSLEKGEWVRIDLADGEPLHGRVRHTADVEGYPSRRVTVVISDEPRERWTYGVVESVKVRVQEGEDATLTERDVDVEDITATPPPARNVDARTEATVEELKKVAGDGAMKVLPVGANPRKFVLHIDPEVRAEQVVDRLESRGYAKKSLTKAKERDMGNSGILTIIADELAEAPADPISA